MDVTLYHPTLRESITVPEEAAWVRLRNGWRYADTATGHADTAAEVSDGQEADPWSGLTEDEEE